MVSERVKFIVSGVAVVVSLLALIIGLTIGLATPPLENGGSPTLPTAAPDVSTDTPDGSTSADVTTESTSGGYTSEFATYRYAAVAADAPHCSEIGAEIMARKGGSTTDAAIASAICIGTINKHSAGVGGGNFMTIYDTPRGETEKKMVTIIARERAPAAAHADMFVNTTDLSTYGGLSVGVPGEVMGYYEAWKIFGRVAWADLIEPSVKLAREGFAITEHFANAISHEEEYIRNDTLLEDLLTHPDGSLLTTGDWLVDELFAKTLERIAEDPMDFYTGSLAEDIYDDLQEYDAIITKEDLAGYAARVVETSNVTLYNGNLTVHAPAPPSSGAVLGYILKILDGYHLNNASLLTEDDQILTYHRIVEAFKFAYAKRSALGDQDYVDVEEVLRNMTSDDYTDYIRSRINDSFTGEDIWYYEPSFENKEDSGTSHVSLMGADGSAASITLTINLYFGSKIRGKNTGIFYNNEMDDFSTPDTVNSFGLPASPSNFIEPGKMPMSSMAPVIITDQQQRAIFVSGASGGSRITSAIAFVAAHTLWLGDRLDIATDRQRLHHQLLPNYVRYESLFSKEVLSGLKAKGHELQLYPNYMAVVGSIHNTCPRCGDDCAGVRCIYAACDGRKGGPPDGF